MKASDELKREFASWCSRRGLRPVRSFSDFGSKAIGEARLFRNKKRWLVEVVVESSGAYRDRKTGVGFGFDYPFGVVGHETDADMMEELSKDG